MPRANIYIRKENWDAWNSSGKSDMVNDLLQKNLIVPRLTPQVWKEVTFPAKTIKLPPGAIDKLKQGQAKEVTYHPVES